MEEIAEMDLKSFVFSEDGVLFSLSTHFSLSRKTQRSSPWMSISIKKFGDSLLCPIEAIKNLMRAKVTFWSGSAEEKLWVSTTAPHGPVTSNTIARWIKVVRKDSGIDTSIFFHSTGSTHRNRLPKDGWSIESILKTGS